MNRTIVATASAFAVGLGTGAIASGLYFKKKYERIAKEDIEAVREAYRKKAKKRVDADAKPGTPSEPKSSLDGRVQQPAQRVDYTSYYRPLSRYGSEDVQERSFATPQIIAPYEFGELEDYPTISLTYYADGVLVDDQGEPVEDIEGMVGAESLKHFGEYEEDAVHVRNERLACDFEILRDLGKYSEARKSAKEGL